VAELSNARPLVADRIRAETPPLAQIPRVSFSSESIGATLNKCERILLIAAMNASAFSVRSLIVPPKEGLDLVEHARAVVG
jgi:hypothetical protein